MLIPCGTRVTCENGHPIATLAVDLWPGATADKDAQFTDWQIPKPAELLDEDMPACPCCGARWHLREVQAHVQIRPRLLKPIYREFVHTEAGWFPPLEG